MSWFFLSEEDGFSAQDKRFSQNLITYYLLRG